MAVFVKKVKTLLRRDEKHSRNFSVSERKHEQFY